uniref:uncharacterized protein n=1 Tax=Lonchura striata TaxID=40157 RepID=UPI001293F8A3|nr:uncharacterized protein LOC110477604 [Lonchura striata domestica]
MEKAPVPPAGGTGTRSEAASPLPPFPPEDAGCAGLGALSPPPLATCCPRRGRAGAGGAGGASRLPQADNALLSFPFPHRASFRGAGRRGAGSPRPGTRARPARPLPLSAASQTFLSWLLGRAGGGERWGGRRVGRAEVRNNKNRTNKQKQSNARDFHVLSQLFLESYFLNCQRGVAPFRTLSAAGRSPKEKRWRPPCRRRDPPSVPGSV